MKVIDMNCKQLVQKDTPARRAEAQRRLDTWRMSAKNVNRLTRFVQGENRASAETAAQARTSAPAKKARKAANPVKAACAAHATATGANPGSAEWWTAYKAGTAWFRALAAQG